MDQSVKALQVCPTCGAPEAGGQKRVTWRTSSGGDRTRDSEFVHYDGRVCLLKSEPEGQVGLEPPTMWASCVCGHTEIHHNRAGKCGYAMICPCMKFQVATN